MDMFQSRPLTPGSAFWGEVDQSQSAPLRRLQPASLPCSRPRVIPGKTAESYSLFNILLGSGIIFTPWQIVTHRLALLFHVCVQTLPKQLVFCDILDIWNYIQLPRSQKECWSRGHNQTWIPKNVKQSQIFLQRMWLLLLWALLNA